MALDLARRGAEAVRDEIIAVRHNASRFTVSLANRQSVADAAVRVGAIDVVINNADIVTGAKLPEAPDAQIQRTFEVNMLALYRVTRAFLDGVVERGSDAVATIASTAYLGGVARQIDYLTSKFAAFGFTESLRNEPRTDRHDVGTLVVCLYYIDTGMFEGVGTRLPRLLPILKDVTVARRVIDGIEHGRQRLIMPRSAMRHASNPHPPGSGFDGVMDVFDIDQIVVLFVGRTTPISLPRAAGRS